MSIKKGRVVNLEWSLLSSDDLDTWSIGSLNTVGKRSNVPIKDTILDGGLGPLHAGNLCHTCGNDFDHCTGHFGKIDLFQPCINVLYFPWLVKILHCICIRCSRLLLSPLQRSKLKCKSYDIYKNKIPEIYKACIKNRNCWFPPTSQVQSQQLQGQQQPQLQAQQQQDPKLLTYEQACSLGYCGYRQPDSWIKFEKILIRPVYEVDDKNDVNRLPVITPLHIYNILKNVCQADYKLFGFDSPLDCLFFSSYPVSPLLIRPSRSILSQDDLTKNLHDLQVANYKAERDVVPDLTLGMIRIEKKRGKQHIIINQDGTKHVKAQPVYLERGAMSLKYVRSKVGIIPVCLESFFNVQRNVARISDETYRVKLDEYNSNGRDRLSLKKRYKANASSAGRVREMINGKRVDLSGRSVISPDTYQDAGEMGVPLKKAMKWAIPEHVNVYNYNNLLQAALNGPTIYPGSNFIVRNTIRFVAGANVNGLRLGDTVERHVRSGDYLLANRQPSLHERSIMCIRARIHDGNTTKCHLAVMKSFAGDFDGDEMTFHVLHDLLSQAEARELMSVGNNMVKDGKLIVGFVQHAAIGIYKLTCMIEAIFSYQDVFYILLKGNNIVFTIQAMKRWPIHCIYINGRQLFQMILTTYDGKNTLTVAQLNHLFFLKMKESIGSDISWISFLSYITRILEHICFLQGVTISLADYNATISPAAIEESNKLITYANHLHETEQHVEQQIHQCLGRSRDVLAKSVLDNLNKRKYPCGLLDVINSGAKGNIQHIAQSRVRVGLQVNGATNERNTLAINHAFPSSIEKYAFIKDPFYKGLGSRDFYYHLQSTRHSLIGQSLNTSDSGYLYRRLWKFLEDLRISFDGSVRNAQNHIIMTEYGFDTTMLLLDSIVLLNKTSDEIISFYITGDSMLSSIIEVYKLLTLRDHILHQKYIPETIGVPVPRAMLARVVTTFTTKNINVTTATKTLEQHHVFESVLKLWMELVKQYHIPNSEEQEAYFFEMLSTRHLKDIGGLQSEETFQMVLDYVRDAYCKSISQDGTPVGFSAAQHIAEPLSQAQLKRMATSGEATPLMTGIARLKEIFNLSQKLQTPWMSVCIRKEFESTFNPYKQLVELTLSTIVTNWYDFPPTNECAQSNCITCDKKQEEHKKSDGLVQLTLFLNRNHMIAHQLRPRVIAELLLQMSEIFSLDLPNVHIRYNTDLEDEKWFLSIQIPSISPIFEYVVPSTNPNSIGYNKNIAELPLPLLSLHLHHALKHETIVLGGIKGIKALFHPVKKDIKVVNEDGNYVNENRLFYETSGCNLLAVCLLQEVDIEHTSCNDINQIFQVFGIDAAMRAIEENLYETMV